jgi:hypothetical protein
MVALMTLSLLLECISYVESRHNPNVKDGRHNDVGLYQHTPIFVAELNRLGYVYSLDDRRNVTKSAHATAFYFKRQTDLNCGIRKYNTGSCSKGDMYLAKVIQYYHYCRHQEKYRPRFCLSRFY